MASTAHSLQNQIQLVSAFCCLVGMVISIPKTEFMAFNTTYPGPYQWLCNDEQLEIVSSFKQLGFLFHAEHGLQRTFPVLKQKMFAA